MDIVKRQVLDRSIVHIVKKYNSKERFQENRKKHNDEKCSLQDKYDMNDSSKDPNTSEFLQKNDPLLNHKHDPTLSSTVLAIQRAKKLEKNSSLLTEKLIQDKVVNRTNVFVHKNEANIEKFQVAYQKHPLSKNTSVIHRNLKKHSAEPDKDILGLNTIESAKRNNYFPNNHTSQLSSFNTFSRQDLDKSNKTMSEIADDVSSASPSPCAPPPPSPVPPPPLPNLPASSGNSVNTGEKKQNPDASGKDRDALLDSIRAGKKLKPTKNVKDSSGPLIEKSSHIGVSPKNNGYSIGQSSMNASKAMSKDHDHEAELKRAMNEQFRKVSKANESNFNNSLEKKDVKLMKDGVSISKNVIGNQKLKNDETKLNNDSGFIKKASDEVTLPNNQVKNKCAISKVSNEMNRNVDKDENSLRKGSLQDKPTISADSYSNEKTAEDESIAEAKVKITNQISNTIKGGPNLKSKDSTSRNFGERMVALQKAGKLISKKEHEDKMQKNNANDKSSSIENESSPKVSWKSEYSVSNEASKTTGSMFGLRPTTTNQHHGKDLSLAGGIKSPSNISTNHFPSSNTQHSSLNSGKQSSSGGNGAQKSPEASSQKKNPINLTTTTKKITSFQSAPKSANVNKSPQSIGNKKPSADDVQICSCVERVTLGASHKCSHSGPNAIHLDMDRVMQFLSESEK